MLLNVGNDQLIEDPTPEQIGRYLRDPPADAPFVILESDHERYVQATPAGDAFRVEWRQETLHRFMLAPADVAEQALLAFRRCDEPALETFPWRRLRPWNDPHRGFAIAAVIAFAILVLSLWAAWR